MGAGDDDTDVEVKGLLGVTFLPLPVLKLVGRPHGCCHQLHFRSCEPFQVSRAVLTVALSTQPSLRAHLLLVWGFCLGLFVCF